MQGIQNIVDGRTDSILSINGYEPILDNVVYGKYLNPVQTDLLMIQKYREPTDSDVFVNLLPLINQISSKPSPLNPSKTEFYLRNMLTMSLYNLGKDIETNLLDLEVFPRGPTTGDLNLLVRKGRFPTDLVDSIKNLENPHHTLINYLPRHVYDEGCVQNYTLKSWFETLFKYVKEKTPIYGQRWGRTISVQNSFISDEKIITRERKFRQEYRHNAISSVIALMTSLRKNPNLIRYFDDISSSFLEQRTEIYVSYLWNRSRQDAEREIRNQKIIQARFKDPSDYPLARLHGDEALPN